MKLVAAAKAAAINAYAPYSDFHVGAALLLDDGRIITGCNFENASYGLSLCAETVALASANTLGALRNIVAVAVAGASVRHGPWQLGPNAVTPCGRCRQMLNEAAVLGKRDLPVYAVHSNGYDTHMLSALLPHSFGPDNL